MSKYVKQFRKSILNEVYCKPNKGFYGYATNLRLMTMQQLCALCTFKCRTFYLEGYYQVFFDNVQHTAILKDKLKYGIWMISLFSNIDACCNISCNAEFFGQRVKENLHRFLTDWITWAYRLRQIACGIFKRQIIIAISKPLWPNRKCLREHENVSKIHSYNIDSFLIH